MWRRFVCKVRGHQWSDTKSPVVNGYWCNRCRSYQP